MPRTFADFYAEIESARNTLVDASIWYAVRGDKPASRRLNDIVSELVEWGEDNIPSET